MTQRLRRILIMIVMALLTVTLMTASLLCSVTYARYAGGKFNEEKSIYDQIIEFVGANQYEVYSPEELVEAIENGYSYIKIGKGAEEPFVITTGVTDVTANLVIDLNGTTIVRNSRNPVLDVQRNVSAVLVYDSTVENDPNAQPGSFYNPVGSALQVSGGTLTVAAGRYDSGPKDGIADAFTAGNATSFKLFKRNGSRADAKGYTAVTSDSAQGQVTMPKLTEDVYIPQNVSSGYNFIEDDTYLIYSKEQNCYVDNGTLIVNAVDGAGDELAVPCNAASCDFYYYYPIDKDGNPIETGGTATAPQTYAVVYGYNDVKGLAEDEDDNNDGIGEATALIDDGLVWPYAAVRSTLSSTSQEETQAERTTGGEGFMRGGAFSTYFGTENTYGIYAEGGTLSVADGVSFTAVGEGVCIRSQTSSTTTDSNAAASLEISGGTFSSELGDTIQMEGGSVTITGGTFNKDASVTGAQTGEGANNGSAIDIQGGTLKVNEKDTTAAATKSVIFNVTGDHVNGIKMTKKEAATQSDVIKNATFNFNETRGGTSVAAIQVAGGSLEVSDSNLNFNRKASSNTAFSHNNGIYVRSSGEEDAAQSGTVTAANCTFNFGNDSNSSVTASAGIASVGGEVTAEDCKFTLPGYSNYGIYATGGETTVTGGSITMTGRGTTQIGSGQNAATGNDNFGINISGGEVTVSGCEISVSGTYSSGILAQGGEVNLSGTDADKTTITITGSHQNNLLTSSAVSSETVTNGGTTTAGTINIEGVVTINSDSLGITARGTVNVIGGETGGESTTVTVTTSNATGVYVNNGTLNVDAWATLDVTSTVRSNTQWVQPPEGQTAIPPSIYNGVYVNGGSLNSKGTLNVTHTGVENDENQTDEDGNALKDTNAYLLFEIKSYAVRVEGTTGTTVEITSGSITNSVGGGVLVNGGTVTLGKQETTNGVTTYSGPTVQTTGDVSYSTEMNKDAGNWHYFLPKTGGPAVKVAQSGSVSSTLTVYGGTYTAQQGDGIVTVGGTSYIHNGTFIGRDYGAKSGDRAGPGASYSFKVYGGTANVYGGTFGGRENGGRYINSSGAFVMGTSADSMGTANIYGGSFVVSEVLLDNADNGGQAGFSVYEYGNVLVAPKGGENGTGTDVTMTGLAAGLVIEGNTSNTVSVEIKGGEFSSTRNHGYSDGIWYSNSNATLTISGGTFTGYARSGLYFEATPNTIDSDNTIMIVQISGGCFKGKPERDGGSSNYKSGAIAGVVGWDKPGYEIGVNYILKIGAGITSSGWGDDETVKDEDGSSKWNDAIQETLASCSWIEIS